MRVTIQRTANETIIVEGSPEEVWQALNGSAIDPQSLTRNDARRYIESGRVGNHGEREARDVRTGRKGVFMMESMGVGFVPGAYVTDSGRIEFEHPWDNPLQGCRW